MSRERPDSMRSVLKRPGVRPSPQSTRPSGGDQDDEIADAAWLYAWSHEALRPVAELTLGITGSRQPRSPPGRERELFGTPAPSGAR